MNEKPKTLGEFLYWFRWNRAFATQQEMADKIGITRRRYLTLEKDDLSKGGITQNTLTKISKATKTDLSKVVRLYQRTLKKSQEVNNAENQE